MVHLQTCMDKHQVVGVLRQMEKFLKGQEMRFTEGLRIMKSKLATLQNSVSKMPQADQSAGEWTFNFCSILSWQQRKEHAVELQERLQEKQEFRRVQNQSIHDFTATHILSNLLDSWDCSSPKPSCTWYYSKNRDDDWNHCFSAQDHSFSVVVFF